MKGLLYIAAGSVILAGGLFWTRPATPQSALPSSEAAGSIPTTVLVTLGRNASKIEKWNGTARVAGGELLASEGRHFSDGDRMTGSGTWECVTRRDDVAPYADVHYTEMRPGDKPEVLFHPVGVFLTVKPAAAARVSIETAQGSFDFALDEIGTVPMAFLGGRVTVARTGTAEQLSTAQYEDDEPAIVALPNGAVASAWVAYKDRADRVMLRTRGRDAWSTAEEVSTKPADIFRCALATDAAGNLWVFWSEREGDRWQIWARQKKAGAWQRAERITKEGSNTFLRAASSPRGDIFVAWQSYRKGQSDIYLRGLTGGRWSDEMQLSESPANDWEPEVAAGPDGSAYVVWDSYHRGNYDVFFRAYQNGKLGAAQSITTSPKFQAHAAIAVDARARPWVAWDESGVNWGKDQGFLIPTPLATPLHQQRAIRVVMWDGSAWLEPRRRPSEVFPVKMRQNAEHPHLAFDANGAMFMVFRHWTRRNDRTIGSPIAWENFVTRYDGNVWAEPLALPFSAGSIEKNPAMARDAKGDIWASWMTDGRPFATQKPKNSDVYCARLGTSTGQPNFALTSVQLFTEPFVEAIPVHNNDAQDVAAARAYTISHSGKNYKIYRGDMHRHTDVSQD
ncbi:MAG: hypothetical protein ABIZ80_05310, partial [Bryobacteraceae bacterium]